MIETLFIQAKTKAGFEAKLSASEVKPDSIAFIEDTREIWTQGVYYPMSEIVTVSNLPGESLLSYNLEGTNYKYRIGDECRFYDTDKSLCIEVLWGICIKKEKAWSWYEWRGESQNFTIDVCLLLASARLYLL